MTDDSDDDFERFLQEEDSASASSASPVKKPSKKSKDTSSRTSAKSGDTKSKSKSKSSRATTSGAKATSGALQAVAAAERLLAASGRSKKKVEVEQVDNLDDDPPPSYTDDPYAYDLGAAYHFDVDGDDDEKETRKKSLSKKKDKTVKSSKKEKVKDLPRREVKSTKSFQERVDEILKRTGSKLLSTDSIAEEKEESDNDASNDAERKPPANVDVNPEPRVPKPANTKLVVSQLSGHSEAKLLASTDADSGDGGESHALSFSDSLGMTSADFEVGLHAKRKLESSRLSLSSLNSEKFAVNADAMADIETTGMSRYERQDENFVESMGRSAAAESDYADDDFEMDQTTEMGDFAVAKLPLTLKSGGVDASATGRESSFVSEFEKMKDLFSLDSPDKVESTDPGFAEADTPGRSELQDTFGYDDEDFETDDVGDASGTIHTAEVEVKSETGVGDLDGSCGGHDQANVPGHSVEVESRSSEGIVKGIGAGNKDGFEDRLGVEDQGAPSLKEPVARGHLGDLEENFTLEAVERKPKAEGKAQMLLPLARTSPVPSRSSPPSPPPPPPPPEEGNQHGPINTSAPPRISTTINGDSLTIKRTDARTVDRFQSIDSRISSLHFVRSPTRDESPIPAAPYNAQLDAISSDMVHEMKEIDELMHQAKKVRDERRRSQIVRSSRSKESELTLRLQQAQRQLLQFKHHVQEMAREDEPNDVDMSLEMADPHSSPNEMESQPTQAVHQDSHNLDPKHYERLQREIQNQDRLIQGFQRENEQLMLQLKQMQRDVGYDVHRENEDLKAQLKDLQNQINGRNATLGDPSGRSRSYHDAVEARLRAEAHAVELKEELELLSKRHNDKVSELKVELDKVKKAKRDVEYRYEGLDREIMDAESRQIKTLQQEMQLQRVEYEHSMSALQKKLDWYVENQRLLDEQDDKYSELKAENKQLKLDLECIRGVGAPSSATSPEPLQRGLSSRSPSDIRRIQELESRLSEMEEAMRKRHPDSLVSLIVASRKVDDESKIKSLEEDHARRIVELEEDIERIQASNVNKLKSFRQQQEKLVLQFQKQILELEQRLSKKSGSANISAKTNRKSTPGIMSEETELLRVRRFYAEKIKEIERKWESKLRSLKKAQHGTSREGNLTAMKDVPDNNTVAAKAIAALQKQIGSQQVEIHKLRASLPKKEEEANHGELHRRVYSLQSQLKASEEARRHLTETLASLEDHPPREVLFDQSELRRDGDLRNSQADDLRRAYQTQLEIVKKEVEDRDRHSLAKVKALEQQLQEYSATSQSIQTQLTGNVKEVERLQELLSEAEKEKRKLVEAANQVPDLEREVMRLQEQLAIPQTPSMLQFRSLELRIETLTQKHQLREAELKVLLAQATQSSQLERLNRERIHQHAISLKNAEIKEFKRQLDEILEELELLRDISSTSSRAA